MSRRVLLMLESKNIAILFGDGAGACLVDPEIGFARIADSCLYTDGSQAEILTIEERAFQMDGPAMIPSGVAQDSSSDLRTADAKSTRSERC